jgi:hypothetical protein
MKFTKYLTTTKEITTLGSCPDIDISYQNTVGETIVIGHYPPDKYYIDGSLPRAKTGYLFSISKFTIAADGIDTSIISNIPINTVVTIGNSSFTVNDGIFEVTSSEVATIVLTFTNTQYLTSTVTINAI